MSAPRIPGREYQELARKARRQGWTVEPTRSGHIRWIPPDGATVLISPGTGSARSWRNHFARMRAAGYADDVRQQRRAA